MDPFLDFTNKTVLITGAASGFGKLLAYEFGSRGANLVLGDINREGLSNLTSSLIGQGITVIDNLCDVSQESNCSALVDSAKEAFGKLDIAINNAGIAQDLVPFEQTTEALMDLQYRVNTKGVLFGMKHQIPLMLEQDGGVILNVSSMAGLGGSPKTAAYSASKHAVIGLTKTAAAEFGKRNVRVNAICPFFSMTPMITESEELQGNNSEIVVSTMSKRVPMKRLGEPEEIVSAMLLLCSPANTYMTGQAIAIDGGVSAL